MFFGILTLLTALSIAGIAAWFSISGLVAIFSANAMWIAIMAGVLETGKLVAASWLYRNWKTASWALKSYLSVAVIVLMLITSMGIFGYLSRAHLDQSSSSGYNQILIEQYQQQIETEQKRIQDAETVTSQLDDAVNTLIKYDRIRGPDGSIAVRNSQAAERQQLRDEIVQANQVIQEIQQQLIPLQQQEVALAVEVGPLKYVAELVYGQADQADLDRAVRLFILMLIFVFDPLAVILLIAANYSLMQHGVNFERPTEIAPAAKSKKKPNPNPIRK